METQSSRVADVICLDLREVRPAPRSYEELRKRFAKDRGLDVGGYDPDLGLQRPWSIVLAVEAPRLPDHAALLESILRSPANPRLIVLAVADDESTATGGSDSDAEDLGVILPSVVHERSDLIRLIVVTSFLGCEWRPGDFVPQGVGMWEQDPDGAQMVPILLDTLSIPEVFGEVFSATDGVRATVWSAGTKQVWFGNLPYEPLASAFYAVGEGLVGDDGKVAVLQRLNEWNTPEELSGGAREDDILDPAGRLASEMAAIRKSAETLKRESGLLGRRQYFQRIGKFPERQVGLAQQLASDIEGLSSSIRGLLLSIDPSDGFSESERRRIEEVGVLLNRDDDSRARFGKMDERTLEVVVAGVQKAISSGHSIAPLRIKLEDLVARVRPRSPEEIVEAYKELEPREVTERLQRAASKPPRGFWMNLGSRAASVLENLWLRLILVLLYLWVGATAVFEAIDLGRSEGYLPLPGFIRTILAVWTVLLFLVLTLLVVLVGVVLNRCDARIRQWGLGSGVTEVRAAVDRVDDYLSQTIMNDWILSKLRRLCAARLESLLEALNGLSVLLRRLLIDDLERLKGSAEIPISPNPAVRQDFTMYSKAGQYANLDEVIAVIRTDMSEIIQSRLALRAPELKGYQRDKVPQQIVEDVEKPIDEYMWGLVRRGVLDQDLAQSDEAIRQRRELIDLYWQEQEFIHELAQDLLLAPRDAPLLQAVSEADLLWLDHDAHFMVRFAPEPSQAEVNKVKTSMRVDQSGVERVVYTESVGLAGLLRLVGFREGIEYGALATRHPNTASLLPSSDVAPDEGVIATAGSDLQVPVDVVAEEDVVKRAAIDSQYSRPEQGVVPQNVEMES